MHKKFSQFPIKYWFCYIDDFLLCLTKTSFYPTVKFTSEKEKNKSLPFLGLLITHSKKYCWIDCLQNVYKTYTKLLSYPTWFFLHEQQIVCESWYTPSAVQRLHLPMALTAIRNQLNKVHSLRWRHIQTSVVGSDTKYMFLQSNTSHDVVQLVYMAKTLIFSNWEAILKGGFLETESAIILWYIL